MKKNPTRVKKKIPKHGKTFYLINASAKAKTMYK